MDLTLTQIGLMIATAIILTAAVTFLANNDMQRRMELESIASQLTTLVQAMDAKSIENTTYYYLPDLGYEYTVTISTEYVTVSAKGFYNNDLSVKKRFIIKPWVQDSSTNPPLDWVGGTALHNFIKNNYHRAANVTDPIQRKTQWETLRSSLATEQTQNILQRASDPLLLSPKKPVKIDKTILYFYQPGEYKECKLGKNIINSAEWSVFSLIPGIGGWFHQWFGSVVEIVDDTVHMSSSIFGQAAVGYQFFVPYESNHIETMYIKIKYQATASDIFGGKDPGPRLKIANWVSSSFETLDNDGLGYAQEPIWYHYNISSLCSKYCKQDNGLILIGLETIPALCGTDIYIHQICIQVTPTVESQSDTQEFVFLYQ